MLKTLKPNLFSTNRMARKEMLLTCYFLLAICLMGLGEARLRKARKRGFEWEGGEFEWGEIGENGGGGIGVSISIYSDLIYLWTY